MIAANSGVSSVCNATYDITALTTEGGDLIEINGTNFGPAVPRAYVTSVTFVSGAIVHAFERCTFAEAHHSIVCVTSPGVGRDYSIQVRGCVANRRQHDTTHPSPPTPFPARIWLVAGASGLSFALSTHKVF